MTKGYEPYRTLWHHFHQTAHFEQCDRLGLEVCPHPLTPEQLAEIKSIVGGVTENRSWPEGTSLVGRFMKEMSQGKWLDAATADLVEGLLWCLNPYQAYEPFANPERLQESNPRGIWDHFKGGVYLVRGTSSWASGNNEPIMEYTSMTYGTPHSRLISQWCEVVKWPDGKYRSRFVYRGPDLHTPEPSYKVPTPPPT